MDAAENQETDETSIFCNAEPVDENFNNDPVSFFKYRSMVEEDHGKPLYGVQFNHCLKKEAPLIFATVGTNRVTVYECPDDGSIKLLQCYEDEDDDEIFYSCAWSYESDTGDPILAAAGLRSVIRIFSPKLMDCTKSLLGHFDAVNELKFHPQQPYLLLSASKDNSLRLWNVKTDVCIANFLGGEEHLDEVLSCDFDAIGSKIFSSGMDKYIKIWNLDNEAVKDGIARSYNFNVEQNEQQFQTIQQHIPQFSTEKIHASYVDCVRWFGDLILSKSCDNFIVCWKPGDLNDTELKKGETHATVIHKFPCRGCNFWFMRFSLDFFQKYLALGNKRGKTFVWDLETQSPRDVKLCILQHPDCRFAIRQTSFSRYGDVLICVCENGTIWRWDKNTDN